MFGAMLESLSKTMHRSSGLVSNLKEKVAAANTISSSSSLGGSSSFTSSHHHHSMTSRAFTAKVIFLDDTSHEFRLEKRARGAALLEAVFNHLDLAEREYFGLVFNDAGGPMPAGHSPDVMRWLDPHKPIRKQMRSAYGGSGLNKLTSGGSGGISSHHSTLYFRVKFYVTDPSRLQEEFTRYHLYLQVKKDLVEGRLTAPISTLCLLTSYAVQSSVGDYDADTCRTGYLANFRDLRLHSLAASAASKSSTSSSSSSVIPPSEELDRRVTELHKLHRGQNPAEAEFNFLEHAKRLEMYGISLHAGKDSHGRDIQLGVTSIGLVVFQHQMKINTFSWSKIVKISFKRKQFFIQLRKELTESYDTLLGFNLASYRSCKNLWKSAVEHHSFFRLHSPKPPSRRFLLNLGSKFRYSGRTEYQAGTLGRNYFKKAVIATSSVHSSSTLAVGEKTGGYKSFPRSLPSRMTLPLTFEGTSNHGRTNGRVPRLASPETSSIGSSVHSNGALKLAAQQQQMKPSAPSAFSSSTSNVSAGKESSTLTASSASLAHRALESFNNKVQSLSTKLPKKAWQEEAPSDDEGGFLDPSRKISSLGRMTTSTPKGRSNGTAAAPASPPNTLPLVPAIISPPNTSQPLIPSALPQGVRFPFADDSTSTSSQSGSTLVGVGPGPLVLQKAPPKGTTSNSSPSTVAARSHQTADSPLLLELGESAGGLVVITIYPDEKGRFGFNVKGGADQKMPIIVSRVGANTPADRCYPKLNEGDQVVLINGRDVSGHTHDQVVNFIRASSEPHSGHLDLAVKQNVYIADDAVGDDKPGAEEEPAFQYVPETPRAAAAAAAAPGSQKALQQSVMLLEEGIESGAIVGQFEQLYRRNPNLSISVCHLPENIVKNRYRDISPYDATRVTLKECPSGDYINANHVKMTIPGSGIINRYIATQGPLAATMSDFWYMTWESQSNLVIMLTTTVERGRVKCHKYWPDLVATPESDSEKENSEEEHGEEESAEQVEEENKGSENTKGSNDPGLMVLPGGLTVRCIKVEECDSFAYRDFELTLGPETRVVTQMAYLSWPDHGVPECPDEFVHFVEKVRTLRQGSLCPTVVHCSAGIGRTGVLILMETAMCLVEANQPVYPLDLTRQMRDQRPSMIQTPSQYRFVCQAILRAYSDGLVRPLPEFCHDEPVAGAKIAAEKQ